MTSGHSSTSLDGAPTFLVGDVIISKRIRGCNVKGLIKLFFFLAICLLLSSIFKGGYYIRLIGDKAGIDLHSEADLADSLRLDTFMAEKRKQERQKESQALTN